MPKSYAYDAIIVGSGPNGLAAAITLAQAGLSVIILEAKQTIGGGMRSAELTLPGFIHDSCSAIHPLGLYSPIFRQFPLSQYGLEWIHPPVPLAHPVENGPAILLDRSIELTGQNLNEDDQAYRQLMRPLASSWDDLAQDLLAPFHFPYHPFLMARFAMLGVPSAYRLAKRKFKGERARTFFAGLAAHSIQPLDHPLTAAFGLILGTLGHVAGWPMPRGGSQKIADALAAFFCSLGGQIVTGVSVENLKDLPSSRVVLFDVTPKQLLKIMGDQLPPRYRHKLERYRYGPGVFKMDWALNHPIPWKDPRCLQAGTVHLGGSFAEVMQSERDVWEGRLSARPFVLLAQQSLFDQTRAPKGKHTAWAYCHVPNGSTDSMIEPIEDQIERFAPGFKACILAKSYKTAAELEHYNPNCVGGDISGGVQDLYQLFTRPVARLVPYSTPVKGIYICSASTPPGGGVHGLCGYYAARAALKECL